MNVLVVGEEDYVDTLKKCTNGCRNLALFSCASPEKSIHLFNEMDFDAVIADWEYPLENVWYMFKMMKLRKPDVKIIISCNMENIINAIRAINRYADYYQCKPVTRTRFLSWLNLCGFEMDCETGFVPVNQYVTIAQKNQGADASAV